MNDDLEITWKSILQTASGSPLVGFKINLVDCDNNQNLKKKKKGKKWNINYQDASHVVWVKII